VVASEALGYLEGGEDWAVSVSRIASSRAGRTCVGR
jgi:hypothetical protein